MHNNYEDCNRTNSDRDDYREEQTHVHEFTGSTKFAEEGRNRHNHRFAGVTGEAIRYGKSHVHKIRTNTDFRENHHHEICDTTGPAIRVGNGKHIHLVKGRTTRRDGHVHEFIFTTLIEDPTEEIC